MQLRRPESPAIPQPANRGGWGSFGFSDTLTVPRPAVGGAAADPSDGGAPLAVQPALGVALPSAGWTILTIRFAVMPSRLGHILRVGHWSIVTKVGESWLSGVYLGGEATCHLHETVVQLNN